jgi:putative ABC transport system permease protein
MLHNYLKVAIRNLFRNRFHSIINLTGLALGMAAATLLLLNIRFELSMDQFHTGKSNLYQAYMRGNVNGRLNCWNSTAAPLTPALKDYPEIANIARLSGSGNLFRYKDQKIPGTGFYADPAFLSMFSFPLIAGNPKTALNEPNKIVVTQRLARKLFGNEDAIDKTINTPGGDIFTITGVMKDLPSNTQFAFEYLLPWSMYHQKAEWNNQNCFTYVELQPDASLDAVNKKIANIGSHPFTNTGRSLEHESVFLYPFTKVYLESKFENGKPAGGEIDNLKLLGGLAGILLVIACINFMNLSTARSEKRGKEVGIRKVIGAGRRSLILQFIGESILMSALAGGIALMIVQFTLTPFNNLIQKRFTIPWQEPTFWLAALGFIGITGVLAGSYPAFYLSSFRPVRVLKGILQNSNALITPRKILVVVQFVFSIFLINFTFTYSRQFQHVLDREVGYSRNDLIYHDLTPDLQRNYVALTNDLLASGAVLSVSKSSSPVTEAYTSESGLTWDGMDPKTNPGFVLMFENGGLVKTNGLTLVAGRDIDVTTYPDDTLSCLINETSAKVLGYKDPVGKIIKDEDLRFKIVGVVKDFLVGSPEQESPPLLVKGGTTGGIVNIRTNPAHPFPEDIRQTETIIRKYNPEYLTSLHFADKDYESKFRQARNTGTLINTFTLIAIFVSCMGLLGLATYMTENRVREIGIRKILGSSVSAIVTLLARDFVKLVLISILIASPLAWFFMKFFLDHFYYRISANGWILVASGTAALFMALATISFQVIRAALNNPVKNLRTD